MVAPERLICEGSVLEDGGKGIRFEVRRGEVSEPAFAIRARGKVYAYLNRCAHVPVNLDWEEGEFFDFSKLYLICATHGATYEPHSGACIAGPCKGQRLVPVKVEELDGKVYLID